MARWTEEMAQREAIHRLAAAKAVPDLTIGAAVRRLDETQDTAAVARVGIELPVFDRNRGNVEAAGSRIVQSEHQRQAARIALTSRFIAAYGLLTASEAKLRGLQREVIPAAEKANRATEQGYREGKFDIYLMNSDGTDNKNITPDYFPADFLCHNPIFSLDEDEIFFIGEWWME